VIRAYLDETGQHADDYVFVAGPIGYKSQWDRFIKGWNRELGVQRERLHMRELRWSKPSTQGLLARLGAVPAAAGLKRLFGGVRVSDYQDLLPGEHAKKVVNGYTCALFATAVSLVLGGVPDGECFELVLEQQDIYEFNAHLALNSLISDPNPLLRTKEGLPKLARWAFAPSSSTVLFDQADYLCYALLPLFLERGTPGGLS
jgi:hypothetical protein